MSASTSHPKVATPPDSPSLHPPSPSSLKIRGQCWMLHWALRRAADLSWRAVRAFLCPHWPLGLGLLCRLLMPTPLLAKALSSLSAVSPVEDNASPLRCLYTASSHTASCNVPWIPASSLENCPWSPESHCPPSQTAGGAWEVLSPWSLQLWLMWMQEFPPSLA